MNHCEFTDRACKRCGWKLPKGWPADVRKDCQAAPQPGNDLDDFLVNYGITKEWSAALIANGHREPQCSNRGNQLEQPLKVDCSCHKTGEKNVPVYDCLIESIRRCLPTFHPAKHDRKKWADRKPESDIYQLCDACPHFRAKE